MIVSTLDDGNRYLYGAGLSAMKQASAWSYYLADGLGSTMAVVDASGAVQKSYQYDVYGEVTGGSGSLANEFGFAGQQTDASTGLQYLRARYYDPASGVFLSRDPLVSLPRSLGNAFSYAGAGPANTADPTGLVPDANTALSSGCDIHSAWCWSGWLDSTEQWWEVTFSQDENMLYLRKCSLANEKRSCADPFSYQQLNDDDWTEEADANAQLAADIIAVVLGLRIPVSFSDHNSPPHWSRHLRRAGISESVAKWQIMLDARRMAAAGALSSGATVNKTILIQGRLVTYTVKLVDGVIRIGTATLGGPRR